MGSSPVADACGLAEALEAAKQAPRARIHAFHRWYGKLVPAIPAAAIQLFTEPGDLVFDPFCGSGTTLVEAVLAGRRAVGCDVNPLAALVSRVKTRPLDEAELDAAVASARERFASARRETDDTSWSERLPSFPNREHFYPAPVARDLLLTFEAARAEESEPLREWLLALASAINRDVSNADARHVFPGVSRRMRALIADGWTGDVPARWERAVRRRVAAHAELARRAEAAGALADAAAVHEVDAESAPVEPGTAALVVTNPPYVSSIRYVETFKLEAFWLGVTPEALRALDRRTLGTERVAPGPLDEEELAAMPCAEARDAARALDAAAHPRLARCVARWTAGLDRAFAHAAGALRPGGRAVVKIGPSRLRGVEIPSPRIAESLFARHGLAVEARVRDEYVQSSRSLTLARNWYSGRMDADAVIVLRKSP